MHYKTTVATIQFPIQPGQVEDNLLTVLAALERLGRNDVRLAVLPEMWSTGFDYPTLVQQSAKTDEVVAKIAEQSALRDMVIVGSLPEFEGGCLYNTTYVLDGGQVVGRYRKLHLFSPLRENRYFKAGQQALVVSTSAGRLGLAICYDLRFPELFRLLALKGADIICVSAEWPAPRQEHWRTLVRARAIENQLFVVAANCCGRQGKLAFFGMSLIVSPRGDILAEAGTDSEEITALLDFADMAAYRQEIPALNDRRADIYGHLP